MSAAGELAGVVLAAGAGDRLLPLTRHLPKALCPVGTSPLVDHAIGRVRSATTSVAVNVHYGRSAMLTHLGTNVHVQVESPEPLGTAGAIGGLGSWVDGRDVLVTNADAWLGGPPSVDLTAFVADWDRERVRLLCVRDALRGDFGDLRYAGACLIPGPVAARLEATPSGLYEVLWRAEHEAGRLDLAEWRGEFRDCGTVGDYLDANLAWSGGESVVDPSAHVAGVVQASVVWADAEVREGVVLNRAVVGPHWVVLAR